MPWVYYVGVQSITVTILRKYHKLFLGRQFCDFCYILHIIHHCQFCLFWFAVTILDVFIYLYLLMQAHSASPFHLAVDLLPLLTRFLHLSPNLLFPWTPSSLRVLYQRSPATLFWQVSTAAAIISTRHSFNSFLVDRLSRSMFLYKNHDYFVSLPLLIQVEFLF